MNKEFCLSNEIFDNGDEYVDKYPKIYAEDVKEFIKQLKEEFHKRSIRCEEFIDKLSGKQLI